MKKQEILKELRRHGGSLAVAAANELENQSTVGAKYVFMRMCKKKILQGRKFSALK